jgi:hypothetical protein
MFPAKIRLLSLMSTPIPRSKPSTYFGYRLDLRFAFYLLLHWGKSLLENSLASFSLFGHICKVTISKERFGGEVVPNRFILSLELPYFEFRIVLF